MNETEQSISCIGFIMDGNRRWAKGKKLPTLEGHRRGAEVFVDTVRLVRDAHIPHAVFYAFSSENWNRSEEEVSYLMDLFAENIEKLSKKIINKDDTEKKVRFRFIGDLGKFSPKLQDKISKVEEESRQFADTTIWVALSYGGRAEIVSAVNRAVAAGQPLDENSFRSMLWSMDMPDPDLIIRTGGQQRLSNFMTWQSVYSELLFIDKFWPDVTMDDLNTMLEEFNHRQRNFGA